MYDLRYCNILLTKMKIQYPSTYQTVIIILDISIDDPGRLRFQLSQQYYNGNRYFLRGFVFLHNY